MSAATVAIITAGFPEGLAERVVPEGFAVQAVSSVRELSGPAAAVLMFTDATSAGQCEALPQLLTLRTGTVPEALRTAPVLILSDHTAETLLRLDPGFLPFVSPGAAVLVGPFDRARVAAALAQLTPATDVVRYFDVEGRLAKLRHQARHHVANVLGPRVLIESARLAGVITPNQARQAAARLPRPDPVAEEYAELQAAVRSQPTSAKGGPTLDVQWYPLRVLLLDDDRSGGWPEALAAVLQLSEATAAGGLPCRSFTRGGFRLDCWIGDKLEAALAALCPAQERRLLYDAVLLDMRLCGEGPDIQTRDLSGYNALESILRADPTVQVVLFTASKNALHVREMLAQEIAGYYPKEDALPDPPEANWGRLQEALTAVTKNLYRREAYWALARAREQACSQEWYRDGDEEGVRKLEGALEHLQALVLLRETALPGPLTLRMRRHVVDSSHAVMEAVLRLAFPERIGAKVGSLVLLPRGLVGRAAQWLNTARNDELHWEERCGDQAGEHAHLWAICAACVALSDGREDGRVMFQRCPLPYWLTG